MRNEQNQYRDNKKGRQHTQQQQRIRVLQPAKKSKKIAEIKFSWVVKMEETALEI